MRRMLIFTRSGRILQIKGIIKMKKHIGVKIIEAESCLGSGSMNGRDTSGKEGYAVKYEDGYKS